MSLLRFSFPPFVLSNDVQFTSSFLPRRLRGSFPLSPVLIILKRDPFGNETLDQNSMDPSTAPPSSFTRCALRRFIRSLFLPLRQITLPYYTTSGGGVFFLLVPFFPLPWLSSLRYISSVPLFPPTLFFCLPF